MAAYNFRYPILGVNIRRYRPSDIESIDEIYYQTLSLHVRNVPDTYRFHEGHYWNARFLNDLILVA